MRSLFLALILAGAAPRALADEVEIAKRHFDKAEALILTGNCKDALPELEEAFLHVRRPEFLYDIARCHERLAELPDDWRSVVEHKRQAIWAFGAYRAMPEARQKEKADIAVARLEGEIRAIESRERSKDEAAQRREAAPARRADAQLDKLVIENGALRGESAEERARRKQAEVERDAAQNEKHALEEKVQRLLVENERLEKKDEEATRKAENERRENERHAKRKAERGRKRPWLVWGGRIAIALGAGEVGTGLWLNGEANEAEEIARVRSMPVESNAIAKAKIGATLTLGGVVSTLTGLVLLAIVDAWSSE